MKIAINKHYWWLIPLLFCILCGSAFLSYNLLPSMGTFTIRRLIAGISIILLIPLFVGFIVSAFMWAYKKAHGRSFSKILKLCLVSPIMFFSAIFIIGTINKSVPIPRLDPYMQLNQYSQKSWETHEPPRRTMVEDLVEKVFPGKNCDEIEKLLGESLDENFGTSATALRCHAYKQSELRYFLSSNGVFGDIDNIQIFFDETGLYSHYEIYTYNF